MSLELNSSKSWIKIGPRIHLLHEVLLNKFIILSLFFDKPNQTKPLSKSIGVGYMNPFTSLSSIKGQMFTEIQFNHILIPINPKNYHVHCIQSNPLFSVMVLYLEISLPQKSLSHSNSKDSFTWYYAIEFPPTIRRKDLWKRMNKSLPNYKRRGSQ